MGRRRWFWFRFLGPVSLVLLAAGIAVRAGNTTCASGQLDWYSNVVGESPCITYQRLRQICNSDYQVPDFRPNTPGDNCDDQVSACCCNTVAFQLSMLCMNCQQDLEAGNQIGIDAGVGAYGLYRGNCGAGVNHTLPDDIQQAVCNLHIKLDDFLYGGWDDGSWFYVYTKESATKDHAVKNNNTFTHCADQISPSVTPTPSHTSSPTSDATITSHETTSAQSPVNTSPNQDNVGSTNSSSNTGAIAGGVVGGVVVALVAVAGFFLYRRQRARAGVATRGIQESHYPYEAYSDGGNPPPPPPIMTGVAGAPYGSMSSRGGAGQSGFSAAQMTSPDSGTGPSGWSDYSSARPSDDALRHTDAGIVLGGLARSASGRLPPAYRSWEEGSTVGSDSQAQMSQQGSGVSSAPPSEVAANPHMPLMPLRLEEKGGASASSARPLPGVPV